jgi:hypothetical protein
LARLAATAPDSPDVSSTVVEAVAHVDLRGGWHTHAETEGVSLATPTRLATVVRSALDDLDGVNAHHEFEHLCRQLALRRIASNIMPATGPVSAGGDQGRDFETYRSYLAKELPFAIGFLALATNETIAFACTIQKTGLKAKIQSDVSAICGHGTTVDQVYIFASAKVPTRVRHDLQQWAQDQHKVGLEIFDRQAIAEMLCEPDLYWIAQEYLHLPTELAPDEPPPEPDVPGWYAELRDDWQTSPREPVNLGDMLELRRGLRHATPPGPARADLDGWLGLMEKLISNTPAVDVRLRAQYELATACLGKADLRPADAHIRRFMADVHRSDDPDILFDASVLIQLCAGAFGVGLTGIALAEVVTWIDAVRLHVNQLLDRDWGPNTRAGLLQAAAHLALQLDYTDMTPRGSTSLDELDERRQALVAAIDDGALAGLLPAAPLADINDGMRRLHELVELLPQAPAYPIDTFAAVVDLLSPSLVAHPLYREVCDGLDAATKRQEGDAAVAVRCRARALAMTEAGRPLDALREFHQAKVNWWHGDTLHGSLLAISSIAEIYASLGMLAAAKKYTLGLAAIAQDSHDASDRDLVPAAMFYAANYDHQAGAWVSSAELFAVASLAQAAYAADPWNTDRYSHLPWAIHYQAVTVVVARQLRPAFEQPVFDVLDRGHLGDFVRIFADRLTAEAARTEEEWLDHLVDMTGPPFSDVGPERVITFSALDVRWTVHGTNNQPTALAIEDFSSSLQILLVELASHDPAIIPGAVDVEIRTYQRGQRPEQTYLTRSQRDKRMWLLFMPAEPQAEDLEATRQHVLILIIQVLLGNSLLDQDPFMTMIDKAAATGLFHMLEIGRPYHELATFRADYSPPLTGPGHRPLNPGSRFPRSLTSHLAAPTGPGSGYSAERAEEILADRYDVLPTSIRYTLADLMRDERVRGLFSDLRGEGWRDWHLLSVVMNLTVTHRIGLRHGPLTSDSAARLRRVLFEESLRAEQPTDPRISPAAVTREAMETGIRAVAASSLKRWGLTLHHATADPDAVIDLLARRYGFWDDDIPHDDPFGGALTPRSAERA